MKCTTIIHQMRGANVIVSDKQVIPLLTQGLKGHAGQLITIKRFAEQAKEVLLS